MKIHFIGGAQEVGGSCSVVEVGSRRILIDCGQRMGGAAESDRLPDLQRVQDLGGLDAILVTHAHADHIGALPLIHLAFPTVPLYTTEATLALMRIMLADSLKIMQIRWMQEAEIPLYPEHAVISMLARVEVVRPGDIFDLCGGELQAMFLLSGHVLGACSLTLDTAEGRIFFTGDYSVDDQRTVDGLTLPSVRPHVVVTEATYGNRMHANRKAEEARLAEAVAQVVGEGGKVLIPAFALGRAQEVLLILLREQRVGRIAKFPIFVDGMVRNVCQIYSLFPDFLGDSLRKQVEREGNPFFFEGSAARAVGQGERELVVAGEACCIVSSSGMLNGGPSQFYAAELAADAKNAIFITGYQDEESPGGKVLALAEGRERQLRLMDRVVQFDCKIAKYNLSAHADAAQIASLVEKLGPRQCYLVHGDAGARAALAPMMPRKVETLLPANGQVADFCFVPSQRQATARPQRPTALTIVPPKTGPKPDKIRDKGILGEARRAVALMPEVLQVGWRPESREILLYMAFPGLFQERRAVFLKELGERLGVPVVLLAKNTPVELAAVARRLLPMGGKLIKPPSLFPDGRTVLKVRFPNPSEEQRLAYQEKVIQATGLPVEVQTPGSEGVAREVVRADGKMELNAAYRTIKDALAEVDVLVLRCGRNESEDVLEVSLLAPWLLDKHRELMVRLQQETGYPIRAGGPNHQALEKKARELLPPSWQLLRRFQWSGREARLMLARVPQPAEAQAVSQKLWDVLGIRIKI